MTWTTPTAPALLRFAGAVAAELSKHTRQSWTAEPSTVANAARLVTEEPGDFAITLRHKANDFDPQKRIKLTIFGTFPTAEDGHAPQYVKPPKPINCSAHRGPAAIASDIARRFWPAYRHAFHMAEQELSRYEQDKARRRHTIQLLQEHANARPASYNEQLLHGPGWDAEVSNDGREIYHISIYSVDIETACEIFRMVEEATTR